MAAMIKAILPSDKVSDSKKEPAEAEGQVRASLESLSSNQQTLKDLERIENLIRKVRLHLESVEKKHASRSWVTEAEPEAGKSAAALRWLRASYHHDLVADYHSSREEAIKSGSAHRYRRAAWEEALDGAASAMTIFPDEDKLGERLRALLVRHWHPGNAVRSEWERVGQYLRNAMEETHKQVTKEEDDVKGQGQSTISTE